MIGSSLDTLELKLVSVHCCWHAEVAVARTFVSFGFKVIGCQSQNVALWLLVLARKRLNCKEDIDIVSLCAVWLPFSFFLPKKNLCQFLLFVLVVLWPPCGLLRWVFPVFIGDYWWTWALGRFVRRTRQRWWLEALYLVGPCCIDQCKLSSSNHCHLNPTRGRLGTWVCSVTLVNSVIS